MAKLFKGKLPSDQREISIIEIDGAEPFRTWDRGLTLRQALGMVQRKRVEPGTAYAVRNVIVADGGRGEVVRELRTLSGGVFYAPGTVPVDYV